MKSQLQEAKLKLSSPQPSMWKASAFVGASDLQVRPCNFNIYIKRRASVALMDSPALSHCFDPAHHPCTDYGPSFFIHSLLFLFFLIIKFYYYYDCHKLTATSTSSSDYKSQRYYNNYVCRVPPTNGFLQYSTASGIDSSALEFWYIMLPYIIIHTLIIFST